MMDQDFQKIIQEKDKEINQKRSFMKMLNQEIVYLNDEICNLKKDGPPKDQSIQQRFLVQKANTLVLHNFSKILVF